MPFEIPLLILSHTDLITQPPEPYLSGGIGLNTHSPPLGNEGRSSFRPHDAICKFDLNENGAHMQKNGRKFKIFVKFLDVKIFRIASLAHLLRYGVHLLLEFLFWVG